MNTFIDRIDYNDDCRDGRTSDITGKTTGNVISPNYAANNTGQYTNDANCQWHIQVNDGYVVKLSVIEFDTELGLV